jgi:hypothetical protein
MRRKKRSTMSDAESDRLFLLAHPNYSRGMTFEQIADMDHAVFEAMTPAEKKQYQDECQQWRRDQALLAMPLANNLVN